MSGGESSGDFRVALVTGASRGLGLALCRALAERSWSLVINARDANTLDQARRELSELTAPVIAVTGDVASDEHQEKLVAATDGIGRLDLLVNNAAALGPLPRPLVRALPLDALTALFRVNTLAPVALIQRTLPLLSLHRGRIINVVSNAGMERFAGWAGYGASKAALDLITGVLALEEPGVRVYAADPGDMRTKMEQEAFPGEDISDLDPPEASVPGLLELIYGNRPSGRYRVRELA